MAGITLAMAQAHLDAWMAADLALATGKAYSIAGRSITRAEASESVKYWNQYVLRLSGTPGIKNRRVVPRDL